MASITFYPRNLLEYGTVTVTGTADTGFPESRLYDRAISLFWKDTVTEAKTFHVDQGATDNIPIDFLAIAKHNFYDEDIAWQWSTDDSNWNDAVTGWTQGDNRQIIKTISTALTKRYWRVTVTSMENPKCSEIFMSLGYSFELKQNPIPRKTDIDNIQWNRSVGGLSRSTKRGAKRKSRNYSFLLSSSQLTNFETVISFIDDYAYPFYIKDHDGNYWLARFVDIPVFTLIDSSYTQVTVNLIELL